MNRRSKIILFSLASLVLVIALGEIIGAVALRARQGIWIYKKSPNYNFMLFEPDEVLVGVPRRNVSVVVKGILYQHNSKGFREKEFSQRKTRKRIACIGGSTTYCIKVNNDQTWPYYLDSLLQPEYEVMNFGIPGHSTAEHKKLMPRLIRQYSPDIIILHAGLNDLRSMNVNGDDNDPINKLLQEIRLPE